MRSSGTQAPIILPCPPGTELSFSWPPHGLRHLLKFPPLISILHTGRKGKKGLLPAGSALLKQHQFKSVDTSTPPLTSYCLELYHMATDNCKSGWNVFDSR